MWGVRGSLQRVPKLQVGALICGLVVLAVPTSILASRADLTPCQGRWEGTAEDPWDPGPYVMKVELTGGTEQCATITYEGMCTSRWIECDAKDDWVRAREVLVDPGTCAEGFVEVQCEDPERLHVRWEGAPGVMQTTLNRVAPPTPPAKTEEPGEQSEPAPAPETKTTARDRGCNCAAAWLLLPGLGLRRRRRR